MSKLSVGHPRCVWILLMATSSLVFLPAASEAQSATSRNEEYEIVHDPMTQQYIVYQLGEESKTRWYAIKGLLGEMFITNDGQYVASCDHWLNEDFRSNEVVVRLYRKGQLHHSLRLQKVLKGARKWRVKKMKGKRIEWGRCTGFTSNQDFSIETIENVHLSVNVSSGRIHSSPSRWPPPEEENVKSAKSWIPNGLCDEQGALNLFCDPLDQYSPSWRQIRGKWEFITEKDTKVLAQQSDHWRERNAIMFFDNLNVSDADIYTFVKTNPTFPELAIADDEKRIRRLRRIAGAGLVFHYQDENNYYMFRLAGQEGAVLGKMVNGEWFDIANPRAIDYMTQGQVVDKDQWLGLRVLIRGHWIQCWIIEKTSEGDFSRWRWQAVASEKDETFGLGKVGLVTFETKASFRYLMVHRPH